MSACSPDYPKCDTDEDCHQGEFCVNNLCQQCRTNDDCPAGQRCASGACEAIPGYCTSNAQCASGQVCENNMCVAQKQAALKAPPPPTPTPTACELNPVYFDFDSSTLSDSARDQLSRNASCLRERRSRGAHLTGLTDPRGTEEYNLALGERRAQSAQQYLKSLGAEGDLSVSSMGEEMASGSDESGWARDRRVDFKVK
ncbi:MAG TPA: OmpA family protein [Polyangiales bacterium]|nr:OmpA family protein [Polyangiales bacterium]